MNTNNENTRTDTTYAVKRGLLQGMAIALGFFGTTIFAVAISGTIKTWTSGEVLKSADLNTTISSMKTAIEGIPTWTKAANGTDAYYTGGNVGIGTSSPSSLFEISGAGSQMRLTDTTTANPIFNFYEGANRTATIESYLQDLYITTKNAKDIIFRAFNTERVRISGGGTVSIKPSGNYNYIALTNATDGNIAWGINENSNRDFRIMRYNSSGAYLDLPFNISNSTGAVTIPGALSKGSGTFDIAHPDPAMPKNSRLRHSFVESPTAGDNIYRWQIKVTRENGKFFIRLPKYWTHLNTNPMVWVSSADQPASSFGYVDIRQEKVIVQADKIGTYNVLLLGTRKDSLAVNNWKELGMEYISKGIGEAEKVLSYNASPEFGEEANDSVSRRLSSEKSASDKKVSALEAEVHRLKTENRRLLSLEDRIRAVETMQIAQAATAANAVQAAGAKK